MRGGLTPFALCIQHATRPNQWEQDAALRLTPISHATQTSNPSPIETGPGNDLELAICHHKAASKHLIHVTIILGSLILFVECLIPIAPAFPPFNSRVMTVGGFENAKSSICPVRLD